VSVTRFNEQNLREIREALESALAIVEEETGLSIELGSCRFLPHSAKFKVEVKTVDRDGRAFDEGAANFKVFAKDFGLEPEYLGRVFVSNSIEYTITGLKPRNKKYPIIATRADGKSFKFSHLLVRHMIKGGQVL